MNWIKLCEPDKWHYGASVYPLLPSDELDALTADIQKNGLLNPILRCDGKILDGRNRLLACRASGVEPKFRDIPIKDASVWARSQNLYRRHLSVSEQAFSFLSLEESSESPLVGTKRVRAYKKLAILKAALEPILQKAQHGLDISADLAILLKPKNTQRIKSIFQIVADQLHLLTNAIHDGEEHVFVRNLEQVLMLHPESESDTWYKKEVIVLLRKIANEFLNYVQKLEETK